MGERHIGTPWIAAAGWLVLIFGVAPAQADYGVVEDFDDLALGSIDGQDGWNISGMGGNVVTLPEDDANQVLEITVDSGVLHKGATIPEGDTRMLFLRFRFNGHHNYSLGMSHLSLPTEFSDFGPELRKASAHDRIEINNGQTYDFLTNVEPLTWYNLWAQIDNDSGNTQVWLHSRPGGGAGAADQLESDGQTVFDFRTDLSRDLVKFYIKAADGGSGQDPLWIDDIYLEDSNALNLTSPVISLPGDYNQDGSVDAADYTVWRNNLGSSVSLPNDDTMGVDLDNYDRWKAAFGETAAGSGSAIVGAAAVPEPAAGTTLLLGMMMALARRGARGG